MSRVLLRAPSLPSCVHVIWRNPSGRRKSGYILRSLDLDRFNVARPKFVKVVNKYFQLKKFIDAMDADKDESIDADFRTGVYLGVGWTHILLSMLPGYLRKPIGFLGYEANRKTGLKLLEQNGGWSSDPAELPIPKGSLTSRPSI